VFDHRTVIVRGIPEHYQRKEILSLFSNFGSLVSIELPLKNLAIENELKAKVDQYQKEKQEQRVTEVRRAQKIVSDSIQENE
jgi:RNA recognition motif-containing protein